jgi:hypothetical protein
MYQKKRYMRLILGPLVVVAYSSGSLFDNKCMPKAEPQSIGALTEIPPKSPSDIDPHISSTELLTN